MIGHTATMQLDVAHAGHPVQLHHLFVNQGTRIRERSIERGRTRRCGRLMKTALDIICRRRSREYSRDSYTRISALDCNSLPLLSRARVLSPRSNEFCTSRTVSSRIYRRMPGEREGGRGGGRSGAALFDQSYFSPFLLLV
jgi:hypothetical protein